MADDLPNYRVTETDLMFQLLNIDTNQYHNPVLTGLPVKCVDYLESDGNQFIDTGIILDTSCRFMLQGQYTTLPDKGERKLGGTGGRLALAISIGRTNAPSSVGEYCFASSKNYVPAVSRPTLITEWHKYEFDVSTGLYSITSQSGSKSTAQFTVPSGYVAGNSVYLFKENSALYAFPSNSKIFGFKVWKNGTLAIDLIPAVDPDGVAAMFDKVANKFLYNQGSGEFTFGGTPMYKGISLGIEVQADTTSTAMKIDRENFPVGLPTSNYRINNRNEFQLKHVEAEKMGYKDVWHIIDISGRDGSARGRVGQTGEE